MSGNTIYSSLFGGAILLFALILCLAKSPSGLWSLGYGEATADSAPVVQRFIPPQVPSVLTSPEERVEHLIAHYWDNFDFRDTTLISRPDITEQALADFLSLLPAVASSKSELALTRLVNSAAVDSVMLAHFIDLTEKYLRDPNSPFFSEEFFIPVLRAVVALPAVAELIKLRPRYLLELALKNRPGEIATDFVYTLSSGRKGRMHALQADYTVLFFNSPDCSDCQRVKEYMAASPVMKQVKKGKGGVRLAILAVYPDGDIPLWRQAEYHRGVINSYDAGQNIYERQLYDLKAIPTLYLLDREKRVILKDASIEQIEAWLYSNSGT